LRPGKTAVLKSSIVIIIITKSVASGFANDGMVISVPSPHGAPVELMIGFATVKTVLLRFAGGVAGDMIIVVPEKYITGLN